jgi:CPA1 family monovalent cation:H+ antiporter
VSWSAGHEATLLVLLVAGGGTLVLAARTRMPSQLLLVLGGAALALIPGAPTIEMPPELVLVVFLPPLLYVGAYYTSLRDLRANLRDIGLLSIGLVLTTTVVVAVVAHTAIDGLAWSSAFILGAVVSPTDAIAVTAMGQRFGLPRRIVVLLEGESLFNDATALVAYRVAVGAAVYGSFSLVDAGLHFLLIAVGGMVVGLAVAYPVRLLRRSLDDPPIEVTLSLMTGYIAFLPAELLHVSGVLAVVAAGVYLGWHAPELTSPTGRLLGASTWETVSLALNTALFALVGLQLRPVLDALGNYTAFELLRDGALVSATVIVIRFLWVFPSTYLPRLHPSVRDRHPNPHPRDPAFVAWAGLRGAVSLAAALALPLADRAGNPLSDRPLIVFLTYCVILTTLVGQGLTTPLVIRLLRLEEDGTVEDEEARSRISAADAALDRLDELVGDGSLREQTAERLRGVYRFRRSRMQARVDAEDDGAIEERSLAYQHVRRELLEAEREAILTLRNEGHISDEAMHNVERELDLEDERLDV